MINYHYYYSSSTLPLLSAYCGTYLKTKNCNKHYIPEKELDDIVLMTLNKHIELVCDIATKIDDIVSTSKIEYNAEIKEIRINEICKEIEKHKKLLDELKKDYKCDFITDEDYCNFKEEYLYELNKLNLEKETLEKSKINSYNLDWINQFKCLGKIKIIDRNIVDSFIKQIYINNDRSADVIFRYSDEYKNAIEYLKRKKNVI